MPTTKPYSIEQYVEVQNMLRTLKIGTEKTGRNSVIEETINYIQAEIEEHFYGRKP